MVSKLIIISIIWMGFIYVLGFPSISSTQDSAIFIGQFIGTNLLALPPFFIIRWFEHREKQRKITV